MFKTISARFSGSLITVIVMALMVGGVGLFSSKQIMDANAKNEFTHEVIESVMSVRTGLLNIETGERGYLLRGSEAYLGSYTTGKAEVADQLGQAQELTQRNQMVSGLLAQFQKDYATWMGTVIDPLIEARRKLNNGVITQAEFDAEVQSRPGKPLMDQMLISLNAVEKEEYRLLDERKAAAVATYERSIWMVAALTLLAIVVGLSLNTLIARMFRRKLTDASGHLNALAEGRLNTTIVVKGQDEVDQMMRILDKALVNLRQLVNNIRQSTEALGDSAASVRTSSGEMSKAAVEQADATASMAAAVEELTVSITQITENSSEASHTAMQAKESADEGMRSLGGVVQSIRSIAGSVNTSAQSVRSVAEQSQEISEIVSTITEIAERTNLLALNAAIEAARAGESGRGFAVVADEVRKLAEQTKGATDRISSMVGQIQSVTGEASARMEQSVNLVKEGIAQADAVSGTITKIRQDADRVNEAIHAISVSMKEQSNVSVEISRNVERVAQMTEENTASIEQNKDVSVQIADLSEALTRSVGVFKTA